MGARIGLVAVVLALLAVFGAPASEAGAVVPVNFTRGTLSGAGFATDAPTAMAFGPDGRLYVADNSGRIQALAIDTATMSITGVEQITTSGELQEVYGITFDPSDGSLPAPVYVTNTVSGFGDAGQAPPGSYLGKVTKISGAGYSTIEDVITGLPVGNSGHQANGLVFGPDGRLLVAQGSMTNAGVVNPQSGLFQREEVPTSAAMLVADIHAAGFDGAITYSPADTYSTGVVQTGGDVSVYATGLRNPYDMIFHSNGKFYNTDNGPNAGYGPSSVTCTTDNGGDALAPDELNIIVEGAYYGSPNRNRGLAGDPRQCVYYSGSDPADADHTAPIALLPASSNGLAEYTWDGFEAQMLGDLIYVSWVENSMHRVQLSADGSSVVSDTTLATGLINALDVVTDAEGNIFVAEWGADQITFFKPDATPATEVAVTGISPPGGPNTGGQAVTITGTNFTTTADTTVARIGMAPLTNVVVQNSMTITAVTTAGSAGFQDIVITNSVGTGTLPGGYNYVEGGGTEPPMADAGSDWSGPIAHNDHSHVTLDGTASTDSDGFIVSYAWYEGTTLLSTNPIDSVEFTLGEHLVTLEVTDNDAYTDTDQVRVIVTLTAENPEPYFCFDVDGDTDVDVDDLALVGGAYGSRFAPAGYTPGYARMYDYNADRVVNSGDVLGTVNGATAACGQTDQEVRAATVWMEQYQNVNAAIAEGFVQITPYVPGQGRHMVKATGVGGAVGQQDDIFIPGEPESLLYEPDSTVPGGWRLGGAMWIMPITLVPLVPQGFTGNEDAWHYHDWLCIWANGGAVAEDVPQTFCVNTLGGIWIEKAGWLVHLWNYHLNPVGRFVEVNDALTDPPATGGATIAVDANVLAPGVQTTATAPVAGSIVVDIVASGVEHIAAFNFDLEYDPAVFSGPVVASGPSVDRNPDANQAFLESTGRAFQCTPPDPDGAVTLGAKKAARISCVSTGSGEGPHAEPDDGAVVASVTLNAIGSPGSSSALTLKNVNFFDHEVTETASCSPAASMTASCAGASINVDNDVDSDLVGDTQDNCPVAANPAQTNSDSGPQPPAGNIGAWSNGPGIPGDDATVANGDTTGDACDSDMDNDVRIDALETAGTGCGGAVTDVSADIAYGDGDGTSWDTDGDVVPDGVECTLGTNPAVVSADDRTVCAMSVPPGDSDGDALLDAWEVCKWGTSAGDTETDGDGLGDCREVMDVNGNSSLTNGDAVMVQQYFFALLVGDLAAMDINGNGSITNGDAVIVRQAFFGMFTCP
jgi:glucose/arabinose dehydrogenase